MKKIVLTIVFAMLFQTNLVGQTLEDLRKTKKTSYLDFILLKIENRLVQRHSLLGTQPMAMRIQYQSVGSQVDFFEEDSKIVISIIGVMHEKRYKKKRYRPKISDCNILRNILLYGKYGYNLIFQKRNKYLTNADMEDIFMERFLNNLSLSENEKNDILKNTIAKVTIIDLVRGNDISCSGKITADLD